jgi:hypothetical protein
VCSWSNVCPKLINILFHLVMMLCASFVSKNRLIRCRHVTAMRYQRCVTEQYQLALMMAGICISGRWNLSYRRDADVDYNCGRLVHGNRNSPGGGNAPIFFQTCSQQVLLHIDVKYTVTVTLDQLFPLADKLHQLTDFEAWWIFWLCLVLRMYGQYAKLHLNYWKLRFHHWFSC